MTLDEAIKHCKEKAEELKKDADYLDVPYGMDSSARTKCLKCAEEHEQLAEWLEDYKRLLEERPQGEWIYFLGCGVGRAMCSECGQLGDIKKYCGYCGAKMKLG